MQDDMIQVQAFNNDLPAEPTPETITIESGESGTRISSGFLFEEYLKELSGRTAITTYDKMRKSDATINATLLALKLPIVGAEMRIQPISEDPKDIEIAEFVRYTLFDYMDGGFRRFVKEALGHKEFGFYYFEKVWEVKDGMVMLKKLAPRLPSAHLRWETNKSDVKGVEQQLPIAQRKGGTNNPKIPMWKLVLFTNNREGDNYEGVSVLRSAYQHYYFKDTFYKLDAIRIERGAGILKITLPEGATELDKRKAAELGMKFHYMENSYVLLPSKEWIVEMMTGGIADQSQSLKDSIAHHDQMIAKNILAQFLNLGATSTGSFALSKDQSDFFLLSLEETARSMAEVINEQVIEDIVNFNFGEQEKYPTLEFAKISSIDIEKMSNVLNTLVNNGIVAINPILQQWAYDAIGLPAKALEMDQEKEETESGMPEEEEDLPAGSGGGEQPSPDGDDDEIIGENNAGEQEPADGEDEMMASEKCLHKDPSKKFGEYFRDLNEFEKRVKLSEIDTFFSDGEKSVEDILATYTADQKAALEKEASRIIDEKDFGAIAGLSLLVGNKYITDLKAKAQDSYEKAKITASNEIDESVPNTPPAEKKIVNSKVEMAINTRNAAIVSAVSGVLINLLGNGIGKDTIMYNVRKTFDETSDLQNGYIVGRVIEDTFNRGRALPFQTYQKKIYALQRTEVLDEVTCPMCISLDGRLIRPDNPFGKLGQVHTNCRGLWVTVLTEDENKPTIKDLPKFIQDRFNTVEGVPATNDFKNLPTAKVTKDSRAAKRQ